MTEREYPKEYSKVEVTFTDGEVKTYRMSASLGISQYLARQVAETGILMMMDDRVTHSIPIDQVREYVISPWPIESTEVLLRLRKAARGE